MDTIDVYRQAIKRTFAGLYRVAPREIDVSWSEAVTTSPCAVRIRRSPTKLSMTMTSPRLNLSATMPSPSD